MDTHNHFKSTEKKFSKDAITVETLKEQFSVQIKFIIYFLFFTDIYVIRQINTFAYLFIYYYSVKGIL